MRLRSFWHFNRVTFFLVDYVLLWGAIVCAFKLSPRYQNDILIGPFLNHDLRFIGYGMPFFMALGLQLMDVQRSKAGFRAAETVAFTVAGLLGGMFAFVILHAVVEFSLIGRFVLLFSLLYGTAFILGSRLLVWKLAEQQRRNVLVYGPKAVAEMLVSQIAAARLPLHIAGDMYLSSLPQLQSERPEDTQLRLFSYCLMLETEEIVVEMPDALKPVERQALLFCTGMGVNVIELGYFFEREFEKVHVAGLSEAWFWAYDPGYMHPVFFAAKRGMDIFVSLLGLLAFAPLFPFIALVSRLQDGGPVIYSQTRTGLNNQPFRIFKIRTMRMDAEKAGAQWAKKNDDRVTWLGRVMRKTRIDEVPQFWNILRGEMSFIGPRPERPELVATIEKEVPYYRYRHLIKPGLTGWAQINYPYGASIEDARQKLAYDLYYMKYTKITREIHIMLRTVVAMVKGAR